MAATGVGVIHQGLKVCRAAAGARIQRATEERRTFVLFSHLLFVATLYCCAAASLYKYIFFLFIRVIQTGPMIKQKTERKKIIINNNAKAASWSLQIN